MQKKGGSPSKQTRYAVLWNNNFYQGIVTQRNPLRSNLGHIEEEYYGNQPCLIDGQNCETSTKLTLTRRPGSSVYNSATFPSVNRYYSFRKSVFNAAQTISTEYIRVIADTANAVYDATGPSTQYELFAKTAGAGSTYFQSVGNNLYFSDGVDREQWVNASLIWAANTSYTPGQFIVDENNNVQEATVDNVNNVLTVQVLESHINYPLGPLAWVAIVTMDGPREGGDVTFSGLTSYTILNGNTYPTTPFVQSSPLLPDQVGAILGTTSSYGRASDTGTATFPSDTMGMTGTTEPVWPTVFGDTVLDGGITWVCKGPSVQIWGLAGPTNPPTVLASKLPTTYSSWTALTFYNPTLVIFDGANLQKLITAGITGSSVPSWSPTLGATTTDGTAVWQNIGPGVWAPSTPYAVNDTVVVTYTYYITTVTVNSQGVPTITTTPVTQTSIFQVSTAGTSGFFAPNWSAAFVTDGTVLWVNTGASLVWATIGPNTLVSLDTTIVGDNGYLENIVYAGKSGSTEPMWPSVPGQGTVDGTAQWITGNVYSAPNTGVWLYAYSWGNSVTGNVTNASPLSLPFSLPADSLATVSGIASDNEQYDQIWIWRTVQGGSVLFFDAMIPSPGPGQSWSYNDTNPDTSLDELIEAPIDDDNDPPPVGLGEMTYHVGRIWGAVNNFVYYSTGPDVTAGNGNEAWSPSNIFVFPSSVARLFPTATGLIVFTSSDVYIIQGTTPSSFFAAPYVQNYGLVSYDAFAVNGSIVYMYTSDNQVVTFDPNSGASEIGSPIGDQFGPGNGTGTFNPTSTRVTWHVAGSQDKGLYVSDFQGTWWRMDPTPSPETGFTWSPKAQIVGGFSAVQSVETSPGTHQLLLGPQTSGPILTRDYSVYSDNGSAYNAFAVLGSLVLAQPGQIAMVESLTTDSEAIGTPITLAVQLDEIAPVTSGMFEALTSYVPDPTELEPSVSLYAQRFYLSQTQQPAVCRHLQIQINWGMDTVKNELLSLSLFGNFEQEK